METPPPLAPADERPTALPANIWDLVKPAGAYLGESDLAISTRVTGTDHTATFRESKPWQASKLGNTARYLSETLPDNHSRSGVAISPHHDPKVEYSSVDGHPLVGRAETDGRPSTDEERRNSLRDRWEYQPRRAERLSRVVRAAGRTAVAHTVGRIPGAHHLHRFGQQLAGNHHGHSDHPTPAQIEAHPPLAQTEARLPINQDLYPNLYQRENLRLIRTRRRDVANAMAAEWMTTHGAETLPLEVVTQIRNQANEQALREYVAGFPDNEKLLIDIRIWAAIAERNARAEEAAAKREHVRATKALRDAARPSGPGRSHSGSDRTHRRRGDEHVADDAEEPETGVRDDPDTGARTRAATRPSTTAPRHTPRAPRAPVTHTVAPAETLSEDALREQVVAYITSHPDFDTMSEASIAKRLGRAMPGETPEVIQATAATIHARLVSDGILRADPTVDSEGHQNGYRYIIQRDHLG